MGSRGRGRGRPAEREPERGPRRGPGDGRGQGPEHGRGPGPAPGPDAQNGGPGPGRPGHGAHPGADGARSGPVSGDGRPAGSGPAGGRPVGGAPYGPATPPNGTPRASQAGPPPYGTPAQGTPRFRAPRPYGAPRQPPGTAPPYGSPRYGGPPGTPPDGVPRADGVPRGGIPGEGSRDGVSRGGASRDGGVTRPGVPRPYGAPRGNAASGGNGAPRGGGAGRDGIGREGRAGPGRGGPGPGGYDPDDDMFAAGAPSGGGAYDGDPGSGPGARPGPRSEWLDGMPPHRPARYRSEHEDPQDFEPARRHGGTDTDQPPLPTGGRAQRRRAAKRARRRRRLRATREVPILVVTALLIALLLKTFLVQAFSIPSGSMENTIQVGDRVVVDKLTPWFGSKPSRGDVVVFRDPGGWLDGQPPPEPDPLGVKQIKTFFTFIGLLPSADEQDLIKRVVAVGGDTVECCDKDGKVTVNGQPLDEPYLRPGGEPSKIKFRVQVPRGRLFMMGDNRSNSADSRFHLDEEHNGTVSEELVVGRAFVIAWPTAHWRGLDEPETFAAVPERAGATTGSAGANNPRGTDVPPIPVDLPIVMSVVGMLPVRAAHHFGRRARTRARGDQYFSEE